MIRTNTVNYNSPRRQLPPTTHLRLLRQSALLQPHPPRPSSSKIFRSLRLRLHFSLLQWQHPRLLLCRHQQILRRSRVHRFHEHNRGARLRGFRALSCQWHRSLLHCWSSVPAVVEDCGCKDRLHQLCRCRACGPQYRGVRLYYRAYPSVLVTTDFALHLLSILHFSIVLLARITSASFGRKETGTAWDEPGMVLHDGLTTTHSFNDTHLTNYCIENGTRMGGSQAQAEQG